MLQGDAALAARDQALPGIAAVLDPAALSGLLRDGLGVSDGCALEPTYVRYKPGTGCLVAYDVRVEGEETWGYARAHRAADRDKMNKTVEKAKVRGPWGRGALVFPNEAVSFAFWPNDRHLPSLERLAQTDARVQLLRSCLPEHPELWTSAPVRLRYKPSRRCVVRLDGRDGPAAVLKVHDAAAWVSARAASTAFSSSAALRVARPLGSSERRRVVVSEWVDGIPLPEAPDAGPLGHAGAIGAALADLHLQGDLASRFLGAYEEARRLGRALGAIEAVAPRASATARATASLLGPLMSQGGDTPVHGDFSPDQVVVGGEGVGVIDLDQAGMGHPAIDLGAFAARLHVEELRGELSPDAIERYLDEVTAGYGSRRPPPGSAQVAARTSAALLRVAVEPFRYRRPEWPQEISAIVERAARVAEACA